MPTEEITAAAAGTWTLGDLDVNRMGFGSMRLTADPDRDLAITVLRRARQLGVNHIDTAAFYVSPGGTLGVGSGPKRYATELIRDALAPYPDDLVDRRAVRRPRRPAGRRPDPPPRPVQRTRGSPRRGRGDRARGLRTEQLLPRPQPPRRRPALNLP